MQLRPELQIQAIIKAMTEDVIPALDQTNQLAMQSAHLTIGTLALIAQHLPLQYRYDRDELQRLVDAADILRSQLESVDRDADTALAASAQSGREVLERARAEPSEILDAVHRLRSASVLAVRAVDTHGNEAVQAAVQATVLSLSKAQLLRDRSWLLMQGWEPDPKSVPAITDLLAPTRAAG